MKKVGVIGLGNMGNAVACNIQRANFPLYVYDIRKDVGKELIEKGAIWKNSPKELMDEVDIAVSMVFGPKEIEEVMKNENGILKSSCKDKVWIDLTTSSPSLMRDLAKEFESLGGLAVCLGMAFLQFDETWIIGVVAGIFVIGQIVSDYILVPRLVGKRVRLHPVWIIFAVLAGGSLFGFVGMLVSVPVAALFGVLVRYGVNNYLASDMYSQDSSANGSKNIESGNSEKSESEGSN